MLSMVCGGCRGQDLQGRWVGPFPLSGATDCVLNMYSEDRFDLGCQDRIYLGGGRYHKSGDELEFNFLLLSRREEKLKRVPTVRVRLEGKGNEIVLRLDNGQEYHLHRALALKRGG